jgi:hypothetical protein
MQLINEAQSGCSKRWVKSNFIDVAFDVYESSFETDPETLGFYLDKYTTSIQGVAETLAFGIVSTESDKLKLRQVGEKWIGFNPDPRFPDCYFDMLTGLEANSIDKESFKMAEQQGATWYDMKNSCFNPTGSILKEHEDENVMTPKAPIQRRSSLRLLQKSMFSPNQKAGKRKKTLRKNNFKSNNTRRFRKAGIKTNKRSKSSSTNRSHKAK